MQSTDSPSSIHPYRTHRTAPDAIASLGALSLATSTRVSTNRRPPPFPPPPTPAAAPPRDN